MATSPNRPHHAFQAAFCPPFLINDCRLQRSAVAVLQAREILRCVRCTALPRSPRERGESHLERRE